mgnify:FL=1
MNSKCSVLSDTTNNVLICSGILWNVITILLDVQKYFVFVLMENAQGRPVNLSEDVPPPENGEREPVLLGLFRHAVDMLRRRFISECVLAIGKWLRPGEKHTWAGPPSSHMCVYVVNDKEQEDTSMLLTGHAPSIEFVYRISQHFQKLDID